MQLLADFLIERQDAFLKQGVRHLRPLTRAEAAAAVGVHESTVSRAAAEKFVLLPNGKVVPLADFFRAALPVQDVMKEIIEVEDGRHLTDREISDRSGREGLQGSPTYGGEVSVRRCESCPPSSGASLPIAMNIGILFSTA